MANNLVNQSARIFRPPIGIVALAFASIFFMACATAPTMKDVEEISPDTRIVFGSVEVYKDGEKETWGTKFTGHNNFYLTILPAGSDEATTYTLTKDGVFFWTLPPGEYTLLGYAWHDHQTQRTGSIGSEFVVPEAGADSYLGSIEFHWDEIFLVPRVEDRFDEISNIYDARFPGRKGTTVRQLLEPPPPIGNFSSIRGGCHEGWGTDCEGDFFGVTPISPEVSQSGFPETGGLQPEFAWRPAGAQGVSYDLILHRAATYTIPGAMITLYMKGRVVAYEEDLKEPRWKPAEPLSPDTRYYWSVRLREGDTVSTWSTQSHSTFLLVYMSSGFGQWFQFKTP
jgi:hypothetical protein